MFPGFKTFINNLYLKYFPSYCAIWLFILNFSFWWTKTVSFNIVQSIDLLCLVYSVCCVGSICLLQIYEHISVWHCLKDFLTSHFDLQSTQNSCLCMVWSVGPDYSFSIWIPNWPALFQREAFAIAMWNDLCPKSRVCVCIGLFLDSVISTGLFFPFLVPIHGEGNGTPRQYSCLETPMDRRAW